MKNIRLILAGATVAILAAVGYSAIKPSAVPTSANACCTGGACCDGGACCSK